MTEKAVYKQTSMNDSPEDTFPFTPDLSHAYLRAADKFRIVEGTGLDYNKRQVWDGGQNRPEGDHDTPLAGV